MSKRFWLLFLSLLLSTLFVPATPAAFAARQETKIKKGVFLVADLRLLDPHFSKTVVLITQHGPGGSVGVVINRPTRMPLAHAFPTIEALKPRSEMIFIGGPVQREVMILLLRTERPPEAAVPIMEKVYVAPPVDTLTDLITRKEPTDPFRIYSGSAGWAPGQLQGEIDRGDWRVLPGDAEIIFQEKTDSIWEEMFRRSSQRLVETCCGDACLGAPKKPAFLGKYVAPARISN